MARMAMLCVVVWGVLAAGASGKTVVCEGEKVRYEMYAGKGDGARPMVMLLHGAGDTPEPMVEAWKKLAGREGIVLVAPALPRRREFEVKALAVFRCVGEDAKRFANVDRMRVYVFGNSMGGYLAYDAMAFDSDYFAAAGVHAMGIDPEYDGIFAACDAKNGGGDLSWRTRSAGGVEGRATNERVAGAE